MALIKIGKPDLKYHGIIKGAKCPTKNMALATSLGWVLGPIHLAPVAKPKPKRTYPIQWVGTFSAITRN